MSIALTNILNVCCCACAMHRDDVLLLQVVGSHVLLIQQSAVGIR